MYNFVASWNNYLQKENGENSEIPGNLTDLAKLAYIRLVVAGKDDLGNYGFVQWRSFAGRKWER